MKFNLLYILIIFATTVSIAQNKNSYNHWEQEIEVDDFGDFQNYEYYYGTFEAPDYLTQVALEITPEYLRIYRLNSDDKLIKFGQQNIIKLKEESGNIITGKGARTDNGGLHFSPNSVVYQIVNNEETQQLKIAIYDENQELISTFSIWSLQPDWY